MMTDAEIAEIAAAWGYGNGSATYIINRLLDELKAARAERDAARAQAFEEAAQIADQFAVRSGRAVCDQIGATIRKRARSDDPDGSRTATSEGKA